MSKPTKLGESLGALGAEFEVGAAASDEALFVRVPTHRSDLTREIDLIEEVLRVRGYDSVEAEPLVTRSTGLREPALAPVRSRIRDRMATLGLSETVPLSFASLEINAAFPGLLASELQSCGRRKSPAYRHRTDATQRFARIVRGPRVERSRRSARD